MKSRQIENNNSNNIPQSLAGLLKQTAQQHPENGILYLFSSGSEEKQSYKQLFIEAQTMAAGLHKQGLKPQDKVIFQFNQAKDFITAFWACILGGFIPIPFAVPTVYEADNNTVKMLFNAWTQFDHPPILTSHHLAEPIKQFSTKEFSQKINIIISDDVKQKCPDKPLYNAQADDLAILSLTSGSTGIPKMVALSHENIIQNIISSSQISQLTSQDISLNWLRLDHVAVLIRCCIRDIYKGNQQIQAPLETFRAKPLIFLDWLHHYQVSFAALPNFAMALVNHQLETIDRQASIKWNLSAVKSIISVAEAIIPQTAKAFYAHLKPYGLTKTQIHSGWGMSEMGGTVTFSTNYLEKLSPNASYVEVGKAMPNFSLRIVDDKNSVIADGEIGHVQGKGPMVSQAYYQNPELNTSAYTPDGWLRTGDLGFLKDNILTITGRYKDIIIIYGKNYHCIEIEATIEEINGIQASYTVACALRKSNSQTDQCLIFFYPQAGLQDIHHISRLVETIKKQLIQKIGISPAYIIPIDKKDFPRTWRGKINRSELQQRFHQGFYQDIQYDFKKCDTQNTHAPSATIKAIDQIGKTAFIVAQWRVEESEKVAPLFYDHMANIFLDQEIKIMAHKIADTSPATQYLVTYRTKIFDDELLEQIQHGIQQVVILGAGLDTRSSRLGADHIRFFEIDKQEVCAFKTEQLMNHGYTLHSTFVACDYTATDFIDKLILQGFDCNKSSYFIWEGNTMYLTKQQIKTVLSTIKKRLSSYKITFDYLTQSFLDESQKNNQTLDSAKAFSNLDAPWITGFNDISPLVNNLGYQIEKNQLLIEHLQKKHPEIIIDKHLFKDYYVCTLSFKSKKSCGAKLI